MISQILSYRMFARVYIGLLIVNLIVGIIRFIKKKRKFKKEYIYALLAIIFGIIATIFAINVKVSIFGLDGRYEGLLAIIYYFSLFFLSSMVEKEDKKIIVNLIIITGVLQTIYAILQIFEVSFVNKLGHFEGDYIFTPEGIDKKKVIWATGFSANPNFYGTYVILCLTSAIGMYIDEKNNNKRLLYIAAVAILFIGLLISNCMSCVLALACILIYLLVYLIKNKELKKIIPIIIIIISCTLVITYLGKTTLIKDTKQTGYEASQISQGNIDTTFGTNRMYIYKNTLKIIPKNMLNGTGIDNYAYAFDGKSLITEHKTIHYDKAHSEYLQILVTEGVFCLLTYLALYACISIKGIKYSFKNKKVFLILPLLAYLIQATFNISVIEVAPIFFIILGLNVIDNDNEKEINKEIITKEKSN